MIETKRLILRRFKMEDKEDCFAFLSDDQTCLDDGGYHAFETQDEEYMQVMEAFANQKNRLMIVEKESDRVIGTIHLMEAERGVVTLTIGYVIAPQYRRKGYAFEALACVMDYCFKNTNLEMILASCFAYNEASKRLLEKLGFQFEGVIHLGIEHAELGPMDLMSYYLEKRDWKRCNGILQEC